mmetsp:Transcript_323/g.282  ORF Transcript_323/g.282 Transcript_323/m.282 type:complete len:329 (-) Transcript_323:14-1000(-)
MSLSQSNKTLRNQESINELTRNAINTVNIGRTTLETLDKQNEDISTIEDTIESNEYIIEKSMKVLRGMTWTGMIYNAFHKDPQHHNTIDNNKINVNSDSLTRNTSQTKTKENLLNEQTNNCDDDLKEILKAVNEIHDISLTMNEALSNQSQTLERISNKTDVVHDMTLAATLKTSQIIRRSTHSSCTFIGRFQFQDINNSYFLSVLHDQLVFTSKMTLNTYFNCYIKEDNLIGIQSYKTLKFLGTTMFGAIRVSGEYMGKQEECFVRLSGSKTGIFILSKNWGNGGWLKYPVSINGFINEVTLSVLDKSNSIEFKAIPIPINDDEENS